MLQSKSLQGNFLMSASASSDIKYLFVLTEIFLACRSEQIISLQTPSLPGYQDHPGQRTGSHKEFR